MAARTPIEIRPEHGYIALGALRLTLVADGEEVLRVGGGARLRAPSFAQRERLVHDALGADDPAPALIAILRARSILERGDLSAGVLDLVAVALAGGEEPDRSFAESARLAGERQDWSWGQILNLPAWIVDRAARGGDGDNGWSTIVFSEPEPADLDVLTREIADRLLRRIVDVDRRPARANRLGPERGRSLEKVSTRRVQLQPAVEDILFETEQKSSESSQARESSTHALPTTPAPATAPPLQGRDGRGLLGRSQSAPMANPRSAQATSVPSWRQGEPPSTARPAVAVAFPTAPAGTSARRWASEMSAPGESSSTAFNAAPIVAYCPPAWSHAAATREVLAAPTPGYTAERRADWMDELARALGAECDLRGIDR